MKLLILFYVISTVVVILIVSTFTHSLIKYTSSTEFCIGCHEMRSTVYKEYQQTNHAKNRMGVSASCADCHMPREWSTTLYRKILAVKDIYHHFIGTIDTKEKFEARRLIMAERVWKNMQENDSRECRNCHDFSSMALDKQKRRASKQHQNAIRDGDTCIECHKGIAHKAVHDLDETDSDQELILDF